MQNNSESSFSETSLSGDVEVIQELKERDTFKVYDTFEAYGNMERDTLSKDYDTFEALWKY